VRVLRALLLREIITRFGRHNLGVLWLVVEPMLFTLGVMGLWILIGLHRGSGIPITAFAITGYSSVLLWRNCATRSGMAIQQNFNLLYHRNVRVLDVLLTRILIEVAGASASFAILSLTFLSLGLIPPPEDLLQVLAAWLMLAWFGAALALVIGAGTAYSEAVERLWHPAAYLLFPLSGAAFMVEWLPRGFQDLVLYLPMVHGVEMLRNGYFGNVVRTHYDVAYMALVCLLLTWFGLFLAQDAGRRVEMK
jgi:ABC-type polysaccharide/polyol phosphate export permease